MKLVVFAHTPPPLHGQSYMVELMVRGLRDLAASNGAVKALEIFHIDAKLSKSAQSVGQIGWSKVFLLLRYCLAAWWHRFSGALRNSICQDSVGLNDWLNRFDVNYIAVRID